MRTIINDGECIKRYMNVWGNLFASCCTAYPTLQHTPSPFHPFFPHLFVGFYYNRDTIVQTISSENFVNQQHQGFQISSNRLNASNPQDRNIVRSFTHRSINDNEFPLPPMITIIILSRALSNIVLRIFPMPSTNLLLLLLLFHSLFLAQSCR